MFMDRASKGARSGSLRKPGCTEGVRWGPGQGKPVEQAEESLRRSEGKRKGDGEMEGALLGRAPMEKKNIDMGRAWVNTGLTLKVWYVGARRHKPPSSRPWECAIGRDAEAMASGRDQECGPTMEGLPVSIACPRSWGTFLVTDRVTRERTNEGPGARTWAIT